MPDLDRRDFLKLVGASAGATAAAGCSDHVEKLIPYVVQPEELTPGNPVFYASTCSECPAGCGLHVKTREGRPIKVEGNPDNPINRGRLCARAQASVGRTYSPDRIQQPMKRGAGGLEPISWDAAVKQIAAAISKEPAKTQLLGGDPGDTANDLVDRFVRAVGAGGRTLYAPLGAETLRAATLKVFGVATEPVFDLSGADLILDFGAEMLDTGPSPVEHARQWAEAREVEKHADGGARLVYVGPRLSVTASSSDEWLPAKPGSEGILALALARAAIKAGAGSDEHRGLLHNLLAGVDARSAETQTGVPADSIRRLGAALARSKAAVALPPGPGLASVRGVAASAAVLVLNDVIGATGGRMQLPLAAPTARARVSYPDVMALIRAMDEGKVGVLLIHGTNPVYSLPESAGFDAALEKVDLVVALATAVDETTDRADLVLPLHAPMESWGDARPRPGIRALRQPTIRPLYDTRELGDALLAIGRAVGGAASRLPKGSWRDLLFAAWSDTELRQALKAGGVYTQAPQAEVKLQPGLSGLEVMAPKMNVTGDTLLVSFPHSLLGDGSTAGLPWMQEIPDPITSVAWDSWAEISLATAAKLGVEVGDVIAIETSAGRLEVAAYPRGGIRDDVVAVPLGQGHQVGHFASKAGQGLAGVARGVNISKVLANVVDESGGRAWLTESVRLSNTGRHRRLPMAQFNDNKRGRELGEVIQLEALAAGAAGHEEHGNESGESPHEIFKAYDPAADASNEQYARRFSKKGEHSAHVSPYRWGMSIDLDKCTGCSACIAACYIENNSPVVGEDETRRVRQMAWLRIDRFAGEGEADLARGRVLVAPSHEQLGNTDIRNSPMLCQQCGAAPCESVCPVIATSHNEEGLNAMVYNRCIGTRYCANNCPYKVRRFNYFDNQLTKWPKPMELGLNPDVTVRGQGVMEKCTFCIQRIQYVRQGAKREGRLIRDGEMVTACQQTCPSGAILFGNYRDRDSALSKIYEGSKRSYHALQDLNTRPSITYLAKVQRGPVEG